LSSPERLTGPTEPIGDGELALRDWREEDAPQVAAACNDPEIQRWIPVPSPYRLEDALEYIQMRAAEREAGRELRFALVRRDDESAVLGSIGIVRPSLRDRRAEIGYWLAPTARGHGYTARAVRMLGDWAAAAYELRRLELIVAVDNAASCAVARAAGYRQEAVLSRYIVSGGEEHDAAVFALLLGT